MRKEQSLPYTVPYPLQKPPAFLELAGQQRPHLWYRRGSAGDHVPRRLPRKGIRVGDGGQSHQVALPVRDGLAPGPAQGRGGTLADGQQQEVIDEGDVFQMFGGTPGIRVRRAVPEALPGSVHQASSRAKVSARESRTIAMVAADAPFGAISGGSDDIRK